VTDPARPIAFGALERGTAMFMRSGWQFGHRRACPPDPEEDLFDGIVMATERGLRFVDRDQIQAITTSYVRCARSDEEAAALPVPDGDPVYTVDALQDVGGSLHDRLGRMFRRRRWTQETQEK
jgi:hypothetical protein